MTRILLIPVAGTLAALAMIAYARQPRGETKHPEMPFDFGDTPEHGAPMDEEEMGDEEPLPEEPGAEEPEPEKTPAPPPREFQLRLEADGSFFDSGTGETFASIDELAETLKGARHTLVITNADGVAKSALDEAEVKLRDRFTIRKVYRAPETPPAEDR